MADRPNGGGIGDSGHIRRMSIDTRKNTLPRIGNEADSWLLVFFFSLMGVGLIYGGMLLTNFLLLMGLLGVPVWVAILGGAPVLLFGLFCVAVAIRIAGQKIIASRAVRGDRFS